ncbi:hypothetical protein MXM84_05590 [Acinetobacter pittii]|nr:hypothetical protein [Acinetobacter sp. BHS4]MEB6623972.1 hypothetical protein [Acinetobacter pittii]
MIFNKGIDIILEGAADLSQSMGLPWQSSHPKVKEKVQEMYAKTRLEIAKSISALFPDNLKILQLGNNNLFSFLYSVMIEVLFVVPIKTI